MLQRLRGVATAMVSFVLVGIAGVKDVVRAHIFEKHETLWYAEAN